MFIFYLMFMHVICKVSYWQLNIAYHAFLCLPITHTYFLSLYIVCIVQCLLLWSHVKNFVCCHNVPLETLFCWVVPSGIGHFYLLKMSLVVILTNQLASEPMLQSFHCLVRLLATSLTTLVGTCVIVNLIDNFLVELG